MTAEVALVMAPLLPQIRTGRGNMCWKNGGVNGGVKGGGQEDFLSSPLDCFSIPRHLTAITFTRSVFATFIATLLLPKI